MKMVEITADVRHDSDIFYPGERRMMEDADAQYFVDNGWGTTEGMEVSNRTVPLDVPADVTLKVNPGKHSARSKEL